LLNNSIWFARELSKDEVFVGYFESAGETCIRMVNGQPEFQHKRAKDGVAANMNYFAALDRAGLEWRGTDNGVLVSSKGRQVHLSDRDGLIWNDCNPDAFFADSDGSVWIGTTRGLAHAMLSNPMESPRFEPRIGSLLVNGKPIDSDASISVPAMPNSLEVKFSPLIFASTSRLEYQFRLLQNDSTLTTRSSPEMSFVGIAAGSARLQARMRVDQGDWSDVLVDLPVEVQSTFWQSWAGRLIQLAMAIAVLTAIWRYRHNSLIAERTKLKAAVDSRTAEIERLLAETREASRLKTEFLANMSHETCTPMNGVLGTLQLASATELNSEQSHLVELAKSSAKSLLSLLNEILDLSKVESGIMAIDPHPFHVSGHVTAVQSLLAPSALAKGIQLQIQID